MNFKIGDIVWTGATGSFRTGRVGEYLAGGKIIDIKKSGGKNFHVQNIYQVNMSNKSWFNKNPGDIDICGDNEFLNANEISHILNTIESDSDIQNLLYNVYRDDQRRFFEFIFTIDN